MKKYFLRANTSSGCISFADENLHDMTVVAVKGKSKYAKTEFLKRVSSVLEKSGAECEWVMSPFDIKMLDAIILHSGNMAFVDSDITANCNRQGKTADATADIDCAIGESDNALELFKKRDEALDMLYGAYGEAKSIHDEWESVYISETDYDRLGAYTSDLAEKLINSHGGGGKTVKRFFGASTPDGSVNYINELTGNLKKRYFIKGRPGTGKSTFLKHLANKAKCAGLDTEIYYCSFDKDSLDMVVVPELGFCVFDSTAPHELFPKREGDEIVDFYTESGLFGVDEKYSDKLNDIKNRYNFKTAQGRAYLRLANIFGEEAEYDYSKNIDYEYLYSLAERTAREALKKL